MLLTHLRTLREISRLGSFSRAAEVLRLSQPAVSHHIRLLEDAYGCRLLERVGKRTMLTHAGEVVMAHAARAFDALDAAHGAGGALGGKGAGRIGLGTGATASIYILPAIPSKVQRCYPDIEIVVVTGNSGDIARAVAATQLDVGVVTLPVRDRELAITPFRDDRLVAIAPPTPAWKRRGALTPHQ